MFQSCICQLLINDNNYDDNNTDDYKVTVYLIKMELPKLKQSNDYNTQV